MIIMGWEKELVDHLVCVLVCSMRMMMMSMRVEKGGKEEERENDRMFLNV